MTTDGKLAYQPLLLGHLGEASAEWAAGLSETLRRVVRRVPGVVIGGHDAAGSSRAMASSVLPTSKGSSQPMTSSVMGVS